MPPTLPWGTHPAPSHQQMGSRGTIPRSLSLFAGWLVSALSSSLMTPVTSMTTHAPPILLL